VLVPAGASRLNIIATARAVTAITPVVVRGIGNGVTASTTINVTP
jgi:hypothetical protein